MSDVRTKIIERQLRGQAEHLGYILKRIPERSRDYDQYGPYMLVDVHTNAVWEFGFELEDVYNWINEVASS